MSHSPAPPPNPTPSARFAWVIDAVLKVVAHRRVMLGEPMLLLIWWRLRRLQRRFDAVLARVLAGKAPRVRQPRAGAGDAHAERPVSPDTALSDPVSADPALPDPGVFLPRGHAWLHKLLGEHAPPCAAALRHLFSIDPEMMALVASDPGFGRVLRPLFDMLGMKPTACVPPPQKFTRTSRRRAGKPRAAKAQRAPRPVKPVTGRALQKYLPWKGPRPFPKPKPREASVPEGRSKSSA